MYKASRDFIKARQPYARYELELVSVKQLQSLPANECLQNSTDDQLLAKGNKVVSGWIVNAFDTTTRSTAIVQHWWNIDARGQYFDLTAGVLSEVEYIVDSAISEYGQEMYNSLDNLVAMSLLYKDGKFLGVREDGGVLTYKHLDSLSNQALFDLL